MIKGIENQLGKVYYGKVVDNNDPDKEGHCKVNVFGLFDELTIEDIPWAAPGSSKSFGGGEDGGFGDISIPKINAIVKVIFPEGNMYSPEWIGIAYINNNVIQEIGDTYLNSNVLAYDVDEELKILYTPGKGLVFYHKESQIIINPDSSITIEHKGGQSIIELIGDNLNIVSQASINVTSPNCIIDSKNVKIGEEAAEKLILGDAFMKLFNSHTHVGNLGAPTSVPIPLKMNATQHLSKIAKTE